MTTSSPRSLGEILERHFPREELLASRVMEGDSAGRLQLNQKLNRPHQAVLGLRDATSGELFDLLTEKGLVCRDEPSIFAALRDRHTEASMGVWENSEPMLLAAASLADVILLRSLGLPTALTDRLVRPDREFVDRFGKAFWPENRAPLPGAPSAAAAPSPAEEAPGHAEAPGQADAHGQAEPLGGSPAHAADVADGDGATASLRLMLVGWSPATLQFVRPEGYLAALRALRRLEGDDRIDGDLILGWDPTPEEGERLREDCQSRCPDTARAALVRSIRESSSDLFGLWDELPDVPPVVIETLPAATEQLELAFGPRRPQDGPGVPREPMQDKALADYRRIVQRDLIQPWQEEAVQTSDPVRRNVCQILSTKVRRYHEFFLRRHQRQYYQHQHSLFPHAEDESVKELYALENDLLKALREHEKCHSTSLFAR